MVRAMIGMAHSLGLTVVAEGIETEHQRDYLAQLGCQQGQGYLFGRPMPADELAALTAGTTPSAPATGSVPRQRRCSRHTCRQAIASRLPAGDHPFT
jgi:predicted signal transduction protein with EAL and GGDEF domain